MTVSTISVADPNRSNILQALCIIDAVGKELSSGVFAHQTQEQPLERIAPPSEAEAARRSALGNRLQAEIAAIHQQSLPADLSLSLRLASATAARLGNELGWYWHVHDPLGLGFFGLFGPTAYCGGWYLSVVAQELGRHRFAHAGDAERYLGLVADVATIVHSMRERLAGQAARGIAIPKAQLIQACHLMAKMAPSIERQLDVSPERRVGIPHAEAFGERLRTLIECDLRNAFLALNAYLQELDVRGPPQSVGISQYPGGAAIYEALIRLHTTLDLDADQVHAAGKARIAVIQAQMADVRSELGFAGTDADCWEAIGRDPRWRASTSDGVAARFEDCLQRVVPMLQSWFHTMPASPYGVAPLPESLADSMTFGYYQIPPTPSDPGRYLFNVRNLTQSSLAHLPALAFHELVPGHHVHLSSQAQDNTLPALNKFNSFNAFNEGWAEYAATLAGEVGLYQSPEERFGRLRMDAFLTCRLVVDTGLNALGWSLAQGQAYLRDNGFMAHNEARTEAIRYACDLPAQSLAYKLGDTFLLAERARMRNALGDRFDLRDFHQAVLKSGAIPLPLVSAQIDRAIARINRTSTE